MSDTFKHAKYIFEIVTTDYAGNFERELCAYCTGNVGDCSVGEEQQNKFLKKYPEAFDNMVWESDDNGCARPVTGGGKDYQSVLLLFETRPTEAQIKIIMERAKEFAQSPEPYSKGPRIKQILAAHLYGYKLIRKKIKLKSYLK